MLKSIQNFENQNLRNYMREIATGSLETVNKAIKNPDSQKDLMRSAFESALQGIRTGVMKYENDPLLPILQKEVTSRIDHFKSLSPEEESKLLSLNQDQRRIIADQDRK